MLEARRTLKKQHVSEVSPSTLPSTMSEMYRRLGTSALGRGSYSYVYAAWDSKESRTVAIKVQKSESDEAVREMMFFQSIPSHKHLLEMLDTFVQQARLCLVFEYLHNCL